MKPTFKGDKLGRINPTNDGRPVRMLTKRISLRPKSMTRSKSLKPFGFSNQVAERIEKSEK